MKVLPFALVLITMGGAGASAAPRPLSPSAVSLETGKSMPIHWTDIQQVSGGRLIYRASKIALSGDRFAITASVTNKSSKRFTIRALAPEATPSGTVPLMSFGIAYREAPNPNITTRHLINIRAQTFRPHLPSFLGAGQTWAGTFSGSSAELRSHHTWWIVYGLFYPGNGLYSLATYWVSDRTFST